MKKIGLSIVLVSLMALTSQAKTYSQEDMDAMQKKIQELEAKLADHDKKFSETEEYIDELYERADQNEFEAAMNRIKWGGELEVSDNFFDGKAGSITGMLPGKEYTENNQWTTKLRLSMESKINDKLKFTGRLSMYKNWSNNTDNHLVDTAEGRKPDGSDIYVERAYVDYAPIKNLIFTIGRQPSSDGPGMTLIENTKRKSTYPAILFDGAADGIVVTYKAAPKSSFKPVFRAAYGKGFQENINYSPYTISDTEINDLNVYGAFYEMNLPWSEMGDNLLVLSYVYATDFIGFPAMIDVPNNKNLGDMALAGVYFENNKAFGTNLNYFISFGYSMPDANGNTVNLGEYTANQDVGLINDDGYAIHVGARYDFEVGLKLGYEFNHGSEYWYSFTSASADLLNKLSTRGDVHDLYAIYQIDLNQFLRLGYTMIDYDYTGSGWHIGQPMKTDDYVDRAYVVYNVRF